MILDPQRGHCGRACVSFCHRWISVHLTINPERRLHPCGLHQDREEGAEPPPASSAAFCVLRSQATEGASNHSIRAKRPQGNLRRPVACLDDTRILHLFDVLPIGLPLR